MIKINKIVMLFFALLYSNGNDFDNLTKISQMTRIDSNHVIKRQ